MPAYCTTDAYRPDIDRLTSGELDVLLNLIACYHVVGGDYAHLAPVQAKWLDSVKAKLEAQRELLK